LVLISDGMVTGEVKEILNDGIKMKLMNSAISGEGKI